MQRYEFKAVPAPSRAGKVKGVRGGPERFAHEVARILNEAAAEGWDYVRTDTLPFEERRGFLMGRATSLQNLMIFRRERAPEREGRPEPVLAAVPEAPPQPAPIQPSAAQPIAHEGAPVREEPPAPSAGLAAAIRPLRAGPPLASPPPAASLDERRDALAGSLTPHLAPGPRAPAGAPPRIGGARRD